MLAKVPRVVVAMIVQTLLYGIYLETLIQCLRWLIFIDEGWKPREKINSHTLTFTTIFIFFTSTINHITTLQFALEILSRDKSRHTTRYNIGIAMSVSESLTLLSIDYVLIYRCWIVYAKAWRIICVPVTFWLGSLACSALYSYYGTVDFSRKDPIAIQIDFEQMVLLGLYVCNIATTIYTTTAIIYRIWYTSRKTSGSLSPKRLNYIMRILAESGILYTCTAMFRLAGAVLVSVTRTDAIWVNCFINDISDAINFSMAGISFNLLLIRVYQSRVERRGSLAESRNDDGV
ncbi:hypothetical protein M378DRAFT_359464 [Amanita muscaria Koide BX008]|uniref:G protein-coupled receptor n=1 Tax=Amanita muscaria (strain Koide BX008) TaxID=946122 RepID=A0A0C2WNQ4_AMAMK|nr:hypothetical protein M378DRAFT_359464 [Amanita muscaria Koide BX008]